MKHLLSILVLLPMLADAQNVVEGRVLSVVDGHPLSGFRLAINDHWVQTDSNGSFRWETRKRKIHVRSHFNGRHGIDTTVQRLSGPLLFLAANRVDSNLAVFDIRNRSAVLFCCAGVAPVAPHPENQKRLDSMGVRLFVVGDTPPAPFPELIRYNRIIARHLDSVHGTAWRQGVFFLQ